MSTTLLIIIGIIVIAVILIVWFSKSLYDLAEEVSEKKAERRRRQRLLHDLSVLLQEEEVRNTTHQMTGSISNQFSPDQSIDPNLTSQISATTMATEQQSADHMEIVRQQEEDFRRASTGIEFGGTNPDVDLNPMAHHIVDEMMDSSAPWSDSFANDIGMTDPFPDSWDNGYSSDPGLDSMSSSGFDPFNGF